LFGKTGAAISGRRTQIKPVGWNRARGRRVREWPLRVDLRRSLAIVPVPTDSLQDRRGEFFRGRQEGGVPTSRRAASRRLPRVLREAMAAGRPDTHLGIRQPVATRDRFLPCYPPTAARDGSPLTQPPASSLSYAFASAHLIGVSWQPRGPHEVRLNLGAYSQMADRGTSP